MGKLLNMLPKPVREKIEEIKRDRAEAMCDKYEGWADISRELGHPYWASNFYNRSAKIANSMNDKERELRLLLRKSDSQEDFAADLERTALQQKGLRKAIYLEKASNWFMDAAFVINKVDEASLNERKKRLLEKARDVISKIPSGEDKIITRLENKLGRLENICKLRE
jgi:hypothetical protein